MGGMAALVMSSASVLGALPGLVPLPQSVREARGFFALKNGLGVQAAVAGDEARLLEVLGSQKIQAGKGGQIVISRGTVENPTGYAGAYRLKVTPEKIEIVAADAAGAFYAAETLRQLLSRDAKGNWQVPCVEIADWAAFQVRGMMLDLGRNYQSMDLVKEQIDWMARYKLNVFHFHATDNPGWRLESKVHPEVTKEMTRQPGKFYTQDQVRELIAYCKARQITLIPEMDMPGHTEALRKSMGIDSMNSRKARDLMKDLLSELMSLAPASEMPYIHIGTDEVRGQAEKVDGTFLREMVEHVEKQGRKVIGWRPGIEDSNDPTRIVQLWAYGKPDASGPRPYIDSAELYMNLFDGMDGVGRLFFRQIGLSEVGNSRALGAILCSWPDIRIENERDQLRQNPIYPSMVAFAENVWRGGRKADPKRDYWATLPEPKSKEFASFVEFENRFLSQKSRFFAGKEDEFSYTKQTDFRWRVLGPFATGNVGEEFPPDTEGLKASYTWKGKTYRWSEREYAQGMLHYRHFFGFPGIVDGKSAATKDGLSGTMYAMTEIWSPKEQVVPVWIGFDGVNRSDLRAANRWVLGQWNPSQGSVKVNGVAVAPPQWSETAQKVHNNETPLTNEDYFYRPPSEVRLKKGWNTVLVKAPHAPGAFKWVSTFAPLQVEKYGLKFRAEPK